MQFCFCFCCCCSHKRSRLEWNERMKQRMKNKNKTKFNVEVQVLGLNVYIQFMCVCILGMPCWLIRVFHLHICITHVDQFDLFNQLTQRWFNDEFNDFAVVFFCFFLTLTRKWMAHEYTMNVGDGRREKKKRSSYIFIEIPDFTDMLNKGGISLKATFAFSSVQFCLNVYFFFAHRCTVLVYNIQNTNDVTLREKL